MKLLSLITALSITVSFANAGGLIVPVEPVCPKKLNNNLVRCFIATPVLAIPYCSSFLHLPIVTVTSTTTPIALVTLPQTVSTEVDVLLQTTLLTSISVYISTKTETIFTTTTILAGVVAPNVDPAKAKRDPRDPKPAPTTLDCLTKVKAKSFTASVSSACNCLSGLAASTVSLTTTAPTSTITGYKPVIATTFTTTVVQIVTVIGTTLVTTILETDVLTATSITHLASSSVKPASSVVSSSAALLSSIDSTLPSSTITSTAAMSSMDASSAQISTSSMAAPPTGPPYCETASYYFNRGNPFVPFFKGTGLREPTDGTNGANVGSEPVFTTFPGTMSACQVIPACINFGYNVHPYHYAFDIHYLISSGVWSCNAYGGTNPASYFTITDADVGAAYGYVLAVPQ